MPLNHSSPKSPPYSSPEPISQHGSRPLTTLIFTSRSTSPNTSSSLSPGLVGGLIAIGILALLCAAGVGLHVHYCRQSGSSVCCAVVCFKRSRRSHSMQGQHTQSRSELLTRALITNLLQLMTGALMCKRDRIRTYKLRVTACIYSGPPLWMCECLPQHPSLPLHHPPCFIPANHKIRR